jgi:hypothetical protein
MADNETEQFLGAPSEWAAAQVILADIHGLWGGCSVSLGGDGTCVVTLVRQPGQRDGTYTRRLGADVPRRLFEQCVACDFVTIQFPPRPFIVPDEARPEITLVNAAGDRRTVGCWANVP